MTGAIPSTSEFFITNNSSTLLLIFKIQSQLVALGVFKMIHIVTLFTSLGISTLAFYYLLQRFREEWLSRAEELNKEIQLLHSFYERLRKDEKDRLAPLAQRIFDLEQKIAITLRRIEKNEDTPEKRSKEAAHTAIQEILKKPW